MRQFRLPLGSIIAVWLVCLAPAYSLAQTGGAVEIRQFQPSPFSDRELRMDGTAVLPAWSLHAGLDVDYAWKPLVLTNLAPSIQQSRQTNFAFIDQAVGSDLTVALGLGHRFEVGARLPFTLFQTGDTTPAAGSPGVAGVENPEIGVKARLVGDGLDGFGLGASLLVSLPLGAGGAFIHESGFGGEGRLFADHRTSRWNFGASAGFRLRDSTQLYDLKLGDELVYAAGATLRLSPRSELLAELAGATAAASPFGSSNQSPLEALFGGRRRVGGPGGNFWLTGAAGPGLVSGYGSPVLRVVIGLAWSDRPLRPCLEGPCPEERKELPPPPPKCPGGAGCPPVVPPPPADRDKDGIPDDADECPDAPEDKDGFEDADGCPDPDNDKDGILDAADKCPNEPETINGFEDNDGCPDKGKPQVKIGKEELETLQPIFFETDHSRVRHAFYNILGQIALTLKAHPEIGRCAVEGHTDDTGPPQWNQKLSLLRADAVVEFLVNKGVARERLSAIGHGEKVPWVSNETESGRAKNRRVIFHIEGVDADEQQKLEERQRIRVRNAAARAEAAKKREQEKDRDGEKDKTGAAPGPVSTPAAPAPAAPEEKIQSKADDKPSGDKDKAAKKTESKSEPKAEPKPDAKPVPPPTLHELLKLPPNP